MAVLAEDAGSGGMPILLWYLPFTMFSGACDLVFAELTTQLSEEPPDLDEVGPEDEATTH
jgi:hypothetical protein